MYRLMIHLVWRSGAQPDRSQNSDRPLYRSDAEAQHKSLPDEAINQSMQSHRPGLENRAQSNSKLETRMPVPRVSHAPYAVDEDYIAGLSNESLFLRPKSSHETA